MLATIARACKPSPSLPRSTSAASPVLPGPVRLLFQPPASRKEPAQYSHDPGLRVPQEHPAERHGPLTPRVQTPSPCGGRHRLSAARTSWRCFLPCPLRGTPRTARYRLHPHEQSSQEAAVRAGGAKAQARPPNPPVGAHSASSRPSWGTPPPRRSPRGLIPSCRSSWALWTRPSPELTLGRSADAIVYTNLASLPSTPETSMQ